MAPRARPEGSTRGRPRDPTVEHRVFEAAVAIYDVDGWSGFTFDAVAGLAEVGKSTIYRRWSTKEDLLIDALTARTRHVTVVDTGSLHGDLVQLAAQMVDNYTRDHGLVSMRLFVDASHNPALAARMRSRIEIGEADFGAVFSRAVARGELPDHRYNDRLREVISGATMHRVLTTDHSQRHALAANARDIGDEIVTFALAACR